MMYRPEFPDHTDILMTAGAPFSRCGKHSVRINHRFFAELFRQERALKNFDGLGFVAYTGNSWDPIDERLLRNDLEALIANVALEYDLQGEVHPTEADLVEIVKIIKRRAWAGELPKPDPDAIPAANVLLRWCEQKLDFEISQYSSDIFVTSRLPVGYDPAATAPKFEAILKEIMPDSEDRRVAQEYLGAALFFVNRTRKFLLCLGEGGCGKTILSLFLIKILGASRARELSIENVRNPYELAGLTNQTLLTAPEAISRALCTDGAEYVKKLVGGDFFQTRQKFRDERIDHFGLFSLIVMTNHQLRFRFEGRGDEWRDRVIPIFFDQHVSDERRNVNLVDDLWAAEGAGIFNWFLEGARMVRRNNWKIELSPIQRDRIERLLALSNPMEVFVKNHVAPSMGESFTSADAWKTYVAVRGGAGLPMLEETAFYKQLAKAMGEIYQSTVVNSLPNRQRGYRGFSLK